MTPTAFMILWQAPVGTSIDPTMTESEFSVNLEHQASFLQIFDSTQRPGEETLRWNNQSDLRRYRPQV